MLAEACPQHHASRATPPATHLVLADAGDSDEMTDPAPRPRSTWALGDPVIEADCSLTGRRAQVWQEQDTRWVLLEGEARFELGLYSLRGDRALVRIISEQVIGKTVHHIAVYLDQARTVDQPRAARTRVSSSRLLVTASTEGQVELTVDLLQRRSAQAHPLVIDGMARMRRYDEAISRGVAPLERLGPVRDLPREGRGVRLTPVEGRQREDIIRPRFGEPGEDGPATLIPPQLGPDDSEQSILPAKGSLHFNARMVTYSAKDRAVMLVGQVRVMYVGRDPQRTVSLQAENAVIFLAEGGRAPAGVVGAEHVSGVYLEANVVATDGRMTVRSPRVFYDVQRNRAMLLDAVMYSYESSIKLPLYVRAEKLKQFSRTNWEAQNALVTTSDFAQPHLAIGASKLTVSHERSRRGVRRDIVSADHITLESEGFPFFYLPTLSGNVRDFPIVDFKAGYSNDKGPIVGVTFDTFTLLGERKPDGVDSTFSVGWEGEHGPAFSARYTYLQQAMQGKAEAFLLAWDNGEDEVGGRDPVEFDGEVRGFVRWLHRQVLPDGWEAQVQLSYISDETLLEEFFRDRADLDREWESSLYVKKQEDQWAAGFLTKWNTHGFTAQTTLLQTPGYTVDKAGELSFHAVGISLFENRLSYYTENRVSYLRIRVGGDKPADRGFRDSQSQELFGIPANRSFKDAFEAMGVPTDFRGRFDSRHEVQAPLQYESLHLTPYVSGRVTAYTDDYSGFAGEDEQFRLLGTAGVRWNTTLHQTFSQVDVQALDVHGLRHIVEPHGNVFIVGSTIEPEAIPVYDPDVEQLSEGFGFMMGVRNTLQTRRGGPGQWRTVDWLMVNLEYVYRAGDADVNTPLPRYIDSRPEFSRGGEHAYLEVRWQTTDALALSGEGAYSFETDQMAYWRLGTALRLTGQMNAYVDYSEVETLDSRLLSYGLDYQMTRKYRFAVQHTLDLGRSESRNIRGKLARRMPDWELAFVAEYDEIEDSATFFVQFTPSMGQLFQGDPFKLEVPQ